MKKLAIAILIIGGITALVNYGIKTGKIKVHFDANTDGLTIDELKAKIEQENKIAEEQEEESCEN